MACFVPGTEFVQPLYQRGTQYQWYTCTYHTILQLTYRYWYHTMVVLEYYHGTKMVAS